MTRRAELDVYARPREAGSPGTAGRDYRVTAAPTKAADAAKEATDAR
jgi:hypothetical protein